MRLTDQRKDYNTLYFFPLLLYRSYVCIHLYSITTTQMLTIKNRQASLIFQATYSFNFTIYCEHKIPCYDKLSTAMNTVIMECGRY